MEESKIKKECLKLTRTVNLIYLSTNGSDGYPYNRTMTNLRNKKDNPIASEIIEQKKEEFITYFVTSKSSPKWKQIQADPKVSAYLCDPVEFHTLLICGKAEEVTDMEFKKQIWQDSWKIHWAGGAEDPEFIVMKLLPSYAKGWYKQGPFEFKF
jgi:general stress protein 26